MTHLQTGIIASFKSSCAITKWKEHNILKYSRKQTVFLTNYFWKGLVCFWLWIYCDCWRLDNGWYCFLCLFSEHFTLANVNYIRKYKMEVNLLKINVDITLIFNGISVHLVSIYANIKKISHKWILKVKQWIWVNCWKWNIKLETTAFILYNEAKHYMLIQSKLYRKH